MNYLRFYNLTKNKRGFETKSSKMPDIWTKIHYKEYPRFKKINLPTENNKLEAEFNIFLKRKSHRKFKKSKISLLDISKLLYFSAGVNLTENGIVRRMYPSAGGRYPLETYLAVFHSNRNIKQGIFHYNVKRHSLEALKLGDFKQEIEQNVSYQNRNIIANSWSVIFITSYFGRTEIKYGSRSFRFIMMECGHLAQNMYLISSMLKLGCCAIGGFDDDKINEIIRLDSNHENTILLICLGKI